jgi:hypothetical protein
MEKNTITLVESITIINSPENGLKIKCYRQEITLDFEHKLTVKAVKEVMEKDHATLYEFGEALLAIPRMNAVEVTNKDGIGVHLIKQHVDE